MNREDLKPIVQPHDRMISRESLLLVQLPDGTQAERTAAEWWEHRNEWGWIGILTYAEKDADRENKFVPAYLMMAKIIDNAVQIAMKNRGIFAGSRNNFTLEHLLQVRENYLQGFERA